jgi:hypothetical protein
MGFAFGIFGDTKGVLHMEGRHPKHEVGFAKHLVGKLGGAVASEVHGDGFEELNGFWGAEQSGGGHDAGASDLDVLDAMFLKDFSQVSGSHRPPAGVARA